MSQNRVGLTFEALIHENKKRPNNRLQVTNKDCKPLGKPPGRGRGGRVGRTLEIFCLLELEIFCLQGGTYEHRYVPRCVDHGLRLDRIGYFF